MPANPRQPRPAAAPRRAFCLVLGIAASLAVGAQGRPLVEIRTDLGRMVVELYNETPAHRDRFLELVRNGAYEGLLFHRAVPGFVVQGGDPGSHEPTNVVIGLQPPTAPLAPELVPGLVHTRGSLAAVPVDLEDGSVKSHGQQFCIVLGGTFQRADLDRIAGRHQANGREVSYGEVERSRYATLGGTPHLDGGNTVFGQVVEGLAVAEAIAALPADAADRPRQDIRMNLRILR